MELLMDRDFIEVWGKGCSRKNMDALDAQRFTSFAISFLSHVQDTYIQYKEGLIDEEIWLADFVLYDPETCTWSRPKGGEFASDAKAEVAQ